MIDEKDVESKSKSNDKHQKNYRKLCNSLQYVHKHQNENSKEWKLAQTMQKVDPR